MENRVLIEPVSEVYLRNVVLSDSLAQATRRLHCGEKKWMKRVYLECVGTEKVDMECINDRKKWRKNFSKCLSNSIYLLSLGYQKCLKKCIGEREKCFDLCRDQAFRVFNEFEPEELLEYCHDKTFVKRVKSTNHSEKVSKAFRDSFDRFK